MLVLTTTVHEKRIIDDNEEKIIDISGSQVKIGIDAPKNVFVHRQEIHRKIQEELAQGESNAS